MFGSPAIGFFRDDDDHCRGYRRPEDTDEERCLALAKHLQCDFGDVEKVKWGDDTFEAEGGEWVVVTEDKANDLWEASLDSYLEECIYPELEGHLAQYFDDDAWKRDARYDGRGHSLSSYDGAEEDSNGFVLFRIN